jgi:hypothetical protein
MGVEIQSRYTCAWPQGTLCQNTLLRLKQNASHTLDVERAGLVERLWGRVRSKIDLSESKKR